MIDTQFNGFGFSRGQLARLPKWIFESWPVTAPATLAVLHFVLGTSTEVPHNVTLAINKWAPACLQIAGGFLVIYSIDQNLGLFQKDSIKTRFLRYIKRFPMCRWSTTIHVDGAKIRIKGGSANVSIKYDCTTMEGRLQQLEHDVKQLEISLRKVDSDLRENLEEIRANHEQRLEKAEKNVQNLERGLTKMVGDGVGLQIFGFLLMAYGAIISASANG